LKRRQSTKPNLVLLDANVIIKAYELKVWRKLTQGYNVSVPSIIVNDEVKYFRSSYGRTSISLSTEISDGHISELTATADEMLEMQARFGPDFVDSIDPGEAEALALLLTDKTEDYHYCSGDGLSIEALAMLNIKGRGVSMEKLLAGIGITKRLEPHFTEDWFKQKLSNGSVRMIQGEGLAGKDQKKKKKKKR